MKAEPPPRDESEDTAAIVPEEVRTGLTPALPQGAVWPAPRETVVVKPAKDDTAVVPPGEAPSDGDATFVAPPAPRRTTGPDIDQTVMQAPDLGATVMQAPDLGATVMQAPGDAATIMSPPAGRGTPDTDATIMQPLPDADATMAGPAVPPPRRPPTSRPASSRPATNRPPTGRPPTDGGVPVAAQHMEPGDAFGTRYSITKMLGVGGMGAVYQAWDSELGVTVAIKTIRPGVGTDASTALDAERRFKRELLLARQVTHPNVVRIYDLGEIEGTKYITMSFVDGEDLASVLAREGKLPVERALPIMRQVMAGMGAAHAAGIVHRDLKPANIMVDQSGQALVMDFGIARSVDGPATEPTPAAGTPLLPDGPSGHTVGSTSMATHALTVAGSVMGTLDYMAPEQARGQAVDQRADVYALGLIMRDVMLGRAARPKSGNAFQDLRDRMSDPLPSPRTVDAEFPEAVDQIITRALALDPAERYATAQALADALGALDDKGVPKPIFKRLTRPMMAAMAAGVALLVAGTWYLARGPEIPVEHEPVALVIADFQNQTGDPAFDQTLEPVMKLALEGAGFISAFDRTGIARSLGVRPPDQLDEKAAVELAVKQGVGVVVSGAVTKDGNRFGVTLKVAEAVTGRVITQQDETSSSKDGVIGAVTNIASEVREALGDTTPAAAQRYAMETLSATSLEVVRAYSKGMDAMSRSRFGDAVQAFRATTDLDPNFGLAWAGMAIASNNMGRRQDAENYAKEAMSRVDGMTERERYRTRGTFYTITNDYQSCVKEYSDLIAKFSADTSARNNRAVCLSKLRDMPTAVKEMQEVIRILPNRALYRVNLAAYAAYAGDAQTAEQESLKVRDQTPWALQTLALAQTLQGQVAQAAESYQALSKSNLGPSYGVSGLADLALYEGRYAEAARIFTEGAAADIAADEPDRAANKLALLAHVELVRGRKAAAIAAADRALEHSQEMSIRFLAARVLAEAGAPDKARAIAKVLGRNLEAESQAYASIIDGLVALADDDIRNAVRFLTDANEQMDTWIGHFDLGRAYLAAEAFPQADSEFDRCLTRRGEAVALFLDEEPTYGLFPTVYYYQGRVRQGLRSAGFAESFKAYLAIRGTSPDDPFVPEARKLAGGQ